MKTLLYLLTAYTLASLQGADSPKSPDQRIVVELVAEAPDIVTPTGVGVDA